MWFPNWSFFCKLGREKKNEQENDFAINVDRRSGDGFTNDTAVDVW